MRLIVPEIFLLKKKNIYIYIAWGSLPTIRITKDGHDERQRRRERQGGRRGLEREKSLIINTEVGETRSNGAQGKDENEDDDEETTTT